MLWLKTTKYQGLRVNLPPQSLPKAHKKTKTGRKEKKKKTCKE